MKGRSNDVERDGAFDKIPTRPVRVWFGSLCLGPPCADRGKRQLLPGPALAGLQLLPDSNEGRALKAGGRGAAAPGSGGSRETRGHMAAFAGCATSHEPASGPVRRIPGAPPP